MKTLNSSAADQEPLFRPRRLGHANIFVADLEESMRFYRQVVGLEISYTRPEKHGAFFTNGNTHHDIGMVGPYEGRKARPGLNHLGIELDNEADLVAGYRQAVAGRLTVKRTADHEIVRSVYVTDPNGVSLEVYADSVADWRAIRSGSVPGSSPAWDPLASIPDPTPKYDPAPVYGRVSEAVFHPLRVSHVAMSVENFRDTVDFYIGQIGFRPIVGGRDAEWCALSGTCGEISLALYRAGGDNPAGLHHIGLPLPDANELKMSVTRAKSLGLTVQEAGIGAERCSAFITDPNGILLQFYVAPPGAAGLADLSASRAISLV